MVTSEELQRLQYIRGKLHAHIYLDIRIDGHHKSSEGEFTITLPNCFDDVFGLSVYCYVLGPARNHTWTGKSLTECLDKAEKDIDEWIEEQTDWILSKHNYEYGKCFLHNGSLTQRLKNE